MMFQKRKTVLTNSHISIQTRKRTLECYIEPILMYGCEAWTISKQAQKKLEAVEMWFLRRMMKISWMAKKSNDTVLKEAHTSRALVNKIRTRQTTFFGHVMRREKLEHLITTGMMEGKRSRGKQREKMTDGLANWLGAGKVVEILKASRDRRIWKDMIANAIKHGTRWWWWKKSVKDQQWCRVHGDFLRLLKGIQQLMWWIWSPGISFVGTCYCSMQSDLWCCRH